MVNKLLIICPHLSTGGLPQYVLKKIESLKDYYEVYCIEYKNISDKYTIQKDKIRLLIGNKLISNNKNDIINTINGIEPNIIIFEEIAESFITQDELKQIYNSNRNYKIIETTHSLIDYSKVKMFLPDKFIFVDNSSVKIYENLGIPIEVIEYPIEYKSYDNYKKIFDSNYKHILNIGLFAPNKNQKYAFEIAEKLVKYKIKLHFIGNLAPNFNYYWKPLLENKPKNCIVWGEKYNVEDYLKECDLFLFTSISELNPLVVKEAISYNKRILMNNLKNYENRYDNYDNIEYLSGDINEDLIKIKNILSLNEQRI